MQKKYNIQNNKTLSEKLMLENSLLKFYSELYDYYRNGYTKPKFSKAIKNFTSKKEKLNICICSIGKNENLYIRDFIEYYHMLGIDKIFIYDNNDINGERFETSISDYIKNNFVDLIDIRGLSSTQLPIYNYCYHKYRDYYDWFGFLDLDEFLFIKNNETIKNYFYNKEFYKCQTIFFNWMMIGDNDLLKYDNRSLMKRFLYPNVKFTFGKSFVRGGIKNLIIPNCHIIGINVFYFCNSIGELIFPNNFFTHEFEKEPKAYIKHFYSKTAEEFCNKLIKGNAHFHKSHPKYMDSILLKINYFFRINKKTKEKINILEKCVKFKIK